MIWARMEERMENKKQKYINCIFAILLFTVFAYFVFGEILLPADRLNHNYLCTEYTGEWERVMPDGTREPVSMPGKCKAARNETVVVETKLPEAIEEGRYLCFRSAKQDMKFYIDGKLRQEYSNKEHWHIYFWKSEGKMPERIFVWRQRQTLPTLAFSIWFIMEILWEYGTIYLNSSDWN